MVYDITYIHVFYDDVANDDYDGLSYDKEGVQDHKKNTTHIGQGQEKKKHNKTSYCYRILHRA